MNAAVRPLVAYYRVSTQRQGVSGLGLDAQKAAVREYATAHGLDVLAEFTEVESGKMRARPVLEKAFALANRARATIIVAKLDRLARDAAFVLGLRAAGVEFVACDMPHANRMMVGIMALVAEYESEQVSLRTKAALAAAKARGTVLGGFRGKPGEDAASVTQRGRDAVRAKAKAARDKIRPMVEAALEFADGNYNETARQLNRSEIPTPSGNGEWHARTVARYVDRGEIARK